MSKPPIETRTRTLRLGRELALRALYALDLHGCDPIPEQTIHTPPGQVDENGLILAATDCAADIATKAAAIARHWVEGVQAEQQSHDQLIQQASPRWRIDRMGVVDRNILRIGVFELLDARIPPKDVIFDCVELAKAYGDKGTPAFVNGVLDQICRDSGIVL